MRIPQLIALLILLYGVFIRYQQVDFQNMWWDEGRYRCEAQLLLQETNRAYFDISFATDSCQRMPVGQFHPTGFSTIIASIWALMGESRVLGNLISVLLTGLELLAVYCIASRIAGPWAGIAGMGFLAVNTHHFFVSFKTLNDIMVTSLSAASLFATLFFPPALIILAPALSMTKVLSVALLVPILGYLLLKKDRNLIPILFTLFLFFGIYQLRNILYFGELHFGHGAEWFNLAPLGEWLSWNAGLLFTIPVVLALAGLYFLYVQKSKNYLLIPVIAIYPIILLWLAGSIYDPRLMLPAFFPTYILSGIGLASISKIISQKLSPSWGPLVVLLVLFFGTQIQITSNSDLINRQSKSFQLSSAAYYIKSNLGKVIVAGSTPQISSLSGALTYRYPGSHPIFYPSYGNYSSLAPFLQDFKIDFIEADVWENLQPDYVKNCFYGNGPCGLNSPIAAIFPVTGQPMTVVLKP